MEILCVGVTRVGSGVRGNNFSSSFLVLCNRAGGTRRECFRTYYRFRGVCPGSDSVHIFSTPNHARINNGRASRRRNYILTNNISVSIVTVISLDNSSAIHVGSGNCSVSIVGLSRLRGYSGRVNHTVTLVHNMLCGFDRVNTGLRNFGTCAASGMLGNSNLSSSTTFRILINGVLGNVFFSGGTDTVRVTGVNRFTRHSCFNGPYNLLSRVTSSLNNFACTSFGGPTSPIARGVRLSVGGFNCALYIISANKGRTGLARSCTSVAVRYGRVDGTLNIRFLHSTGVRRFCNGVTRLERGFNSHTILHTVRFFARRRHIFGRHSTLGRKEFRSFLGLIGTSNRSSCSCLRGLCSASTIGRRNLSLTVTLAGLFLNSGNTYHIRNNNFTNAVRYCVPASLLSGCGRCVRTSFNRSDYDILSVHPIKNCRLGWWVGGGGRWVEYTFDAGFATI